MASSSYQQDRKGGRRARALCVVIFSLSFLYLGEAFLQLVLPQKHSVIQMKGTLVVFCGAENDDVLLCLRFRKGPPTRFDNCIARLALKTIYSYPEP